MWRQWLAAAALGFGLGCGRTDLEPEAGGEGTPEARGPACDVAPRRLTRESAQWVTLDDRFAYVSRGPDAKGRRSIARVPLAGGEETRVHEGDACTSECIVTDGRYLYWLAPGGIEVRAVPVGGGAETVVIDDPDAAPLIGVDLWIWPAGGDVYVTSTDAIFRGRPGDDAGQELLVEPSSGEILWLATVDDDHAYFHALSCRSWCQLGVDTSLFRRERRTVRARGSDPNQPHARGERRPARLPPRARRAPARPRLG
ncbi:MAG TPA: hypothetical protein PLU22_05005 [Polyangiaceae bacterium]|mgnify:FL=1|nr:hypothetical protein [Polyangiaceae bacterium]